MAEASEGSTDRLSNLPDEVLGLIVSSLPPKEAVCTSILSTSWHKIYTLISDLNFHGGSTYNSCCFLDFVDGVLSHHVGAVGTFGIDYEGYLGAYDFDKYIGFALLKNVRELDLCLGCEPFNNMPLARVFTCKTLVAIKLRCNSFDEMNNEGMFELELPIKICLPSLKILRLSGVQLQDGNSLCKLLSNSANLEDLDLGSCFFKTLDCKVNVSSPRLKRLTITGSDVLEISIDAPSLVYFKCCQLAKGFLLKNLNSIAEADINIGQLFLSPGTFNAYHRAATNLFLGIGNVKSLRISGFFGEVTTIRTVLIGVLPKVTCFNLAGWLIDGWEKVLPDLLAPFPRLEALFLNVYVPSAKTDQLPSKKFPSFPWSQLKILEFLSFEGTQAQMQIVKFFLKNAKALEKLSVRTIDSEEELSPDIIHNLMKLPKASENCKVSVV